jgi:hypothetical protein
MRAYPMNFKFPKTLLLAAVVISAFLVSFLWSPPARAVEKSPQWFSLEFKGGVWIPTDRTTRNSLGTLEPTGMLEFGFLYASKLGVEVGVGFISANGTSIGVGSGLPAADTFNFTMIPISNSITFRADFIEDQLFVPYIKAGPDYVIFRENNQGTVTSGVKLGLHGTLGVGLCLDRIEDLSDFMENSLHVNDVYFTLEGRYGWINGFGAQGADLSNITATGGLLFEF